MNLLTALWAAGTGASLAMAALHLAIWLRDSKRVAHLLYCFAAIGAAGMAIVELMISNSSSPAQIAFWLRMAQFPVTVLVISVALFIRQYLVPGALWLGVCCIAFRLVALITNFLTGANLNYRQVTDINRLKMPWGETVSTAVGTINPWSALGQASVILLLAYSLHSMIRTLRAGQRRRAVVVGGSIVVFIVLANIHTQLALRNVIHSPIIISFAWLAVVAAMGFELSSDIFHSAELGRDLRRREAQLLAMRKDFELAAIAGQLGLWTWNLRTDRLQLNDVAFTMFALPSKANLNSSDFRSIVQAEDIRRVDHCVHQAIHSGGQYECEFRAKSPDGTYHWYVGRGRVEYNKRGEADLMRGVNLDVTSRRLAEDKFRILFDAAPNALLMLHENGEIALLNAQAERVFGYPREELAGKYFKTVIPESDSTMLSASAAGNGRPGAIGTMAGPEKTLGIRKDNTRFPVEVGFRRIQTEEGEFILASVVDLSAKAAADLELARQREQLTHLSRVSMLGELSGSLAHELNQPLTAILSNAQAALHYVKPDSPESREVAEILKDIVEEDKHAGEVIWRLRQLFKRGSVQLQPVEINSVVEAVLRLLKTDLANHRVSMKLALESHPVYVQGDSVQLQQVLMNLVINASRALANSAKHGGEIVLETQQEDGVVTIAVSDNGPGIPEDKQQTIFEPFYTTHPDGMGLGLAVCKSIVEAHHGKIWALTNEWSGARVMFSLPVITGEVET